jgi:predicted SnoaL-like aldol condensation-catalyzing enzyme
MSVKGEAASPSQRAAKAAVEAEHRRLAVEFHDLVFNRKDHAAARALLHDRYVEHDPAVGDGPDGLAALVERLRRERPDESHEVVRTVADGDHVILHSRIRRASGEVASADIYRVADGRVAEHWTARQPVPETALNDNTMF